MSGWLGSAARGSGRPRDRARRDHRVGGTGRRAAAGVTPARRDHLIPDGARWSPLTGPAGASSSSTRGRAEPVNRSRTTSTRELPWAGCRNIRDLGGQPLEADGVIAFGVALRANNVRNLTEVGWRALVDYGVRRIVDLRWPEEHDEDHPVDVPVEVVHSSLLG